MLALIVILALPLNEVADPVTSPLIAIVRAFCKVVADVALPERAAVIVPAVKLPLASLDTRVDAVFKFVAFVEAVSILVPPLNSLARANDLDVDILITFYHDPVPYRVFTADPAELYIINCCGDERFELVIPVNPDADPVKDVAVIGPLKVPPVDARTVSAILKRSKDVICNTSFSETAESNNMLVPLLAI